MRSLLFALCLITGFPVLSQTSSPGSHQVYALVIGISKYLQKDIPQLQFADRDAKVFADYLKSKAGGAVPAENIQLLVNEDATTSAVYDAIYWLKNTCKKGDLVYFYFSGHGDLETNTMFNNGYLICYDSPPNNYVKLALGVDYVNEIAHTLSAQTNANVVLITDACHSGKLAGSRFGGTFLVGDQLRAVKNKEIRITACATDQLSNENADWGGGRGVFSYYLTNGLKGLADNDNDGTVTADEIKKYLDTSLAKDQVLKRENLVQSPVLNGKGNFILATVDAAERKAAQTQVASEAIVQTGNLVLSSAPAENVPANPRDYFFYLLKKINLEQITEGLHLNQIPKQSIPFTVLDYLVQNRDSGTNGQVKIDVLEDLKKTLRADSAFEKRFNGRLATAFDEKGQQVIDEYLAGDAAELERRRYYNIQNNGYDVYPKMFEVALKLTQPDNYLYNILQVKLHYFAGVATRLKIPTVEDAGPLVEKAFTEQKKALGLEEHAAYIYNELGILSLYKKENDVAEKYFKQATVIAPQWSIPWSNLIGLYANTGKYDLGIDAAVKTRELQPDNQNLFVNSGVLYERKGDLLKAEEYFRKSIVLNSRHYFPFERLGNVYLNTTQYPMADSFFYEAEIRKAGYHFHEKLYPMVDAFVMAPMINAPLCDFDTRDVKRDDVAGNFAWAMKYLASKDSVHAEEKLKLVNALDKTNPLAFHYLGKILYGQKRWKEGDIIFNLAIKYYLDSAAFTRYCNLLEARMPATPSKPCIFQIFQKSYYKKAEDPYFLASLYESWNHFTEAEEMYRSIIGMDSAFLGGYYKLWSMLEHIGRYQNAEDMMRRYAPWNPEDAERELYGFYKRMCARYPESGDWYYKLGSFLYQIASDHRQGYEWDRKYIPPDKNEAVYLPGYNRSFEPDNHGAVLPGTHETVLIAEPCYRPRTEGITNLVTALHYLADDDAVADINQKTGDLYVWQGLPSRANAFYKATVDLKPNDAATRMKLVDTYASTYLLQDALTQLDSLRIRNEINFPKQLLLATYDIHSGRFMEAGQLLQEAKAIHPYVIPGIIDLNGRLQLLSNHPKEALETYKTLSGTNENDSLVLYSIARLYAKLGNPKEAMRWIELSLKKGFNYGYVLRFDPYTEELRKLPGWDPLIKRFTMKKYPPPPKSIL